MNIRATLTCLLALLFALPASAAPTKLAQQGRMLDGDGAPLQGSHEMVFVLYDADSDGTALWTEERSADFEVGYYSITLGEQVPLDDLLFNTESVWLELSIDGETLSPRQEVVSVPYALRATAAEHVEGGMVDAAEISVDGTVVIDASGNWVGPTPAVGWSDLADIPADIADGDQDEDTLAGLACAEGQLPKWDAASSLWICGDDIDTSDPNTDTLLTLVCTAGQVSKWDGMTWACAEDVDTVDPNTDILLGLPCADGYIAKYDGASGLWDCALDADSFADLAGVCLPGDIPVLDPVSGGWICGTDTDTVTSSLPWSAITGIPPELADGDQDTQLTETEVDYMVANNGYTTGAHTVDTDTQLTDAQVAAAALAEGFVTGAHTVDTDTDTLAGLTCTVGQVAKWDGNAWICADFATLIDQDGDGIPAWADCDDTDPSSSAGGGGQTAACAAISCQGILSAGNSTGDGVYWLDPQGTGAFQAYCEMTFNGGGWLAVYNMMERPENNTEAASFHASITTNQTMSQAVMPTSTSAAVHTSNIPLAQYNEVVYGWAPSSSADVDHYGHYITSTLLGACHVDGFCGDGINIATMTIQPSGNSRMIQTGNSPSYPHVGMGYSGQIITWGYDNNASSYGHWANWHDGNPCCNAGNDASIQTSVPWRYVIYIR